MNALIVDENTDYFNDVARYAKYGIKRLYFSYRDPRITAGYLQGVRNLGLQAGIWRGHGWDDPMSADDQALKLSARWIQLNNGNLLPVLIDEEDHDGQKMTDFFRQWRLFHPTLPTAWTMEAFQGGWWEGNTFKLGWMADIKDQILGANVRIMPQVYGGQMEPFDVGGVIRNLTLAGYPFDAIEPVHDASRLYPSWYGCAFTQSRLP